MYSEAEQKKTIKAFRKAVYSPKTPIKTTRKNYDALLGNPILPNNIDIEEIAAGEVPCDVIAPEFAVESFTILYAHGGGFVSGSRYAYRNFCASLAHETACRLVLPEYRLAPEHPYPAALEDLCAAFTWTTEHMAKPAFIIFAGDGAGGNLALSLIHYLKSKQYPLPAAAILFSPWVDASESAHKKNKKNPDPVFEPEVLSRQVLQYTYSSNLANPGVSPIFGDFAGFPPLYIQCGSNELLAEDSKRLAEKARESGAEAELEVFENMWHFFQGFDSVTPEAGTAVKKAGAWARSFQKSLQAQKSSEEM